MQVGMIGLGRMGANLARRLMRGGHECVVYDRDPALVKAMAAEGAAGTASLDDFVQRLEPPRAVWVMIPAGAVEGVVVTLGERMEPDDVIIDGGNTYFVDDIQRSRDLDYRGIHYVDVGTSGGVAGLERGYCLMIGGEEDVVRRLDPLFASLAPGIDAAVRTPGRDKAAGTAEHGYLHCGPSGAGHFVKMVHNGIEYGIMAAYAEGFNILRHAAAGRREQGVDAETAPPGKLESYTYDFKLADIAEVWRRGSVIPSWLLDLIASALLKDPDLAGFEGRVSDSGEGRWTVRVAVDQGVPAQVLTAALYARFSSRGRSDFADKLLSAMRREFGGHVEKRGG